MATLIDFGIVKDELKGVEFMHTMQILGRSKKWIGHDQKPLVLIITNKSLYYGGTALTSNKFFKIPKKDLISVRLTGFLFWKAIEVRYTYNGKERRVYLCPFKGRAERPKMDHDGMGEAISIIEP